MRWYCLAPSLPDKAALRIRAAPNANAAICTRFSKGKAIGATAPAFEIEVESSGNDGDGDDAPQTWLQVSYPDEFTGEPAQGFVMATLSDGMNLLVPWERAGVLSCCYVTNERAPVYTSAHDKHANGTIDLGEGSRFAFAVLGADGGRIRIAHESFKENVWIDTAHTEPVSEWLEHPTCSVRHGYFHLNEQLPPEAQIAIRAFPSKEAETIGLLSRGEVIEAATRNGNWLMIAGPNEAWIMWQTDSWQLLSEITSHWSGSCSSVIEAPVAHDTIVSPHFAAKQVSPINESDCDSDTHGQHSTDQEDTSAGPNVSTSPKDESSSQRLAHDNHADQAAPSSNSLDSHHFTASDGIVDLCDDMASNEISGGKEEPPQVTKSSETIEHPTSGIAHSDLQIVVGRAVQSPSWDDHPLDIHRNQHSADHGIGSVSASQLLPSWEDRPLDVGRSHVESEFLPEGNVHDNERFVGHVYEDHPIRVRSADLCDASGTDFGEVAPSDSSTVVVAADQGVSWEDRPLNVHSRTSDMISGDESVLRARQTSWDDRPLDVKHNSTEIDDAVQSRAAFAWEDRPIRASSGLLNEQSKLERSFEQKVSIDSVDALNSEDNEISTKGESNASTMENYPALSGVGEDITHNETNAHPETQVEWSWDEAPIKSRHIQKSALSQPTSVAAIDNSSRPDVFHDDAMSMLEEATRMLQESTKLLVVTDDSKIKMDVNELENHDSSRIEGQNVHDDVQVSSNSATSCVATIPEHSGLRSAGSPHAAIGIVQTGQFTINWHSNDAEENPSAFDDANEEFPIALSNSANLSASVPTNYDQLLGFAQHGGGNTQHAPLPGALPSDLDTNVHLPQDAQTYEATADAVASDSDRGVADGYVEGDDPKLTSANQPTNHNDQANHLQEGDCINSNSVAEGDCNDQHESSEASDQPETKPIRRESPILKSADEWEMVEHCSRPVEDDNTECDKIVEDVSTPPLDEGRAVQQILSEPAAPYTLGDAHANNEMGHAAEHFEQFHEANVGIANDTSSAAESNPIVVVEEENDVLAAELGICPSLIDRHSASGQKFSAPDFLAYHADQEITPGSMKLTEEKENNQSSNSVAKAGRQGFNAHMKRKLEAASSTKEGYKVFKAIASGGDPDAILEALSCEDSSSYGWLKYEPPPPPLRLSAGTDTALLDVLYSRDREDQYSTPTKRTSRGSHDGATPYSSESRKQKLSDIIARTPRKVATADVFGMIMGNVDPEKILEAKFGEHSDELGLFSGYHYPVLSASRYLENPGSGLHGPAVPRYISSPATVRSSGDDTAAREVLFTSPVPKENPLKRNAAAITKTPPVALARSVTAPQAAASTSVTPTSRARASSSLLPPTVKTPSALPRPTFSSPSSGQFRRPLEAANPNSSAQPKPRSSIASSTSTNAVSGVKNAASSIKTQSAVPRNSMLPAPSPSKFGMNRTSSFNSTGTAATIAKLNESSSGLEAPLSRRSSFGFSRPTVTKK